MSLPLERNSWRSTHGKQPTWRRTSSRTSYPETCCKQQPCWRTSKNSCLASPNSALATEAGSLHAARAEQPPSDASIPQLLPRSFERDNPLQYTLSNHRAEQAWLRPLSFSFVTSPLRKESHAKKNQPRPAGAYYPSWPKPRPCTTQRSPARLACPTRRSTGSSSDLAQKPSK